MSTGIDSCYKQTQYFSFEIHVRKDFDNNAGVHNTMRFSRFERIVLWFLIDSLKELVSPLKL